MTHSDDEGLVLPPKFAPIHVVIVPIFRKDDEKAKVMEAAQKIAATLRDDGLTVELDAREGLKPGAKYYEWGRKGVPMRLELGPSDLESRSVMCKMRVAAVDANGKAVKETLSWDDLGMQVGQRLDAFQQMLFDRALAYREAKTKSVDTWAEFVEAFRDAESGFVYAHWDGATETELAIKEDDDPLPPARGPGPGAQRREAHQDRQPERARGAVREEPLSAARRSAPAAPQSSWPVDRTRGTFAKRSSPGGAATSSTRKSSISWRSTRAWGAGRSRFESVPSRSK